jgi:DedD protein
VDNTLKQRLLGAALLVALAVIFIPMLFDSADRKQPVALDMDVPPEPKYTFEEPSQAAPQNQQVRNSKPRARQAQRPAEVAALDQSKQAPTPDAPPAEVTTTQVPITEPARQRPVESPPQSAQAPATKPAAPPTESRPATDNKAVRAPDNSPPQVAIAEPPVSEKPQAVAAPPPPPPGAVPTSPAAAPAAQAQPPSDSSVVAWAVQVGSFSERENAMSLRDELRASGFAAFEEKVVADGEQVYRVKVGPEFNRERAEDLQARLRSKENLQGIVVTYPAAPTSEALRGGG